MKIIFVLRSIANRGGVERTLIDKANYLATKGHNVLFVTYEQGNHPFAFGLSSLIVHQDLDCRLFVLYNYSFVRRVLLYIKMALVFRKRWNALIDKYQPDVVVVTTYSCDFICKIMGVRDKTRVVVESHSAYTHDMIPNGFVDRMKKRLFLRNIKKCDVLICLTNGDAKCWKECVKNVKTLKNPIVYYPDLMSCYNRKTGRIISVGRLQSQKRYDRLISVSALIAPKYPQWYIDIYGKGNLYNQLKDLIKDKGLEGRVFLHEPIENIYNEYMQSQFLVLSSDYEGLPLVLLEAMSFGLPVISTDCPFGPSEIIKHQNNGLLCEMDYKDLSEKMEWMIIHDDERQAMAIKARQTASHYKKEIVMKQWENTYFTQLNPI